MLQLLLISISISATIQSPLSLPQPFNQFSFLSQSNRGNRIVGGEETDITVVPYTASLLFAGVHSCGCVILSTTHVLTAAHCTFNFNQLQLGVRVGSSYHAHSGNLRNIRRVFHHPNFHSRSLDFDYSVAQLVSAVVFSERVQPIQLANQGEEFEDGIYMITMGWGETRDPNESRNRIRKVAVPIFNQTKCKNAYALINTVTEQMICAGYEEGGRDACNGDSGGGLVYNRVDSDGNVVPTLVGIVSWGYGCALPSFPGVYARISSVTDWIKEIANL